MIKNVKTKKIGAIVIIFLAAYGLLISTLLFANSMNLQQDNMLIVATIVAPLIGAIVALSTPFITSWIKKQGLEEKYRIDLQTKNLEDNVVLFSAKVENTGEKKVVIKKANIYIDEGEPLQKGEAIQKGCNTCLEREESTSTVYYDFPFLLRHTFCEGDDPQKSKCILFKKCDAGDMSYPVNYIDDRFRQMYHTNIELKHLTKDSITHLMPGEQYSEDVILQFRKSGAYRVTLVVVSEKTAKCQCSTKQFYIPKPLCSLGKNTKQSDADNSAGADTSATLSTGL